jgi:predicted outer membrane repeat protein
MRPVGVGKKRLSTVGAAFGLGAAMVMAVAPAGQAALSSCQATDLTSGAAVSADLQGVIDAASPGDTVQVEGVCFGGFVIDKDLTVVGKATAEVPQGTLDGNGASGVLSLGGGDGVEVILSDLTITHGSATDGGGIHNSTGAVTLNGSTSVSGNTASDGAGIFSEGKVTLNGSSSVSGNAADYAIGGIGILKGSLTLNGSSSVSGNTSAFSMGGIGVNRGTVTLNNSSTVADNNARIHGGIYTGYGSVTLNDSSSVSGNSATFGGGGISSFAGSITLNDSALVSDNFVGHDVSRADLPAVTEIASARQTGDRASAGGGIFSIEGPVTLNGSSSVSGNTARRGGGILSQGAVTLNGSSSVSGNTARRRGAGIFIRNSLGAVTLADLSSVTGNTARLHGGGIFNDGGTVDACNSIGANEWTGAISPNTPDDPPTPTLIPCS